MSFQPCSLNSDLCASVNAGNFVYQVMPSPECWGTRRQNRRSTCMNLRITFGTHAPHLLSHGTPSWHLIFVRRACCLP
jgi:hypothetical protein